MAQVLGSCNFKPTKALSCHALDFLPDERAGARSVRRPARRIRCRRTQKYAGSLLGTGRRFIGAVTRIALRPSTNRGCLQLESGQTRLGLDQNREHTTTLRRAFNKPCPLLRPSNALTLTCAAKARVPTPRGGPVATLRAANSGAQECGRRAALRITFDRGASAPDRSRAAAGSA